MIVKVDSLLQYVTAISGLFVNKNSPNGVTRAELDVLCTLWRVVNQEKIDRDKRIQAADQMNMKLQVLVNYINKLKKKGAITKHNTLHPIFFSGKVQINWQYNGETTM